MSILELYKIVDPTVVWECAMDNQATVDSWYLYELHNFHHNEWGAKVWIFDGVNDFVRFLPALIFNGILYYSENLTHDEIKSIDVSAEYSEFLRTQEGTWDEARCLDFVRNFKSSKLELKEFGRLSAFFTVAEEQFELCKDEPIYDPEIHEGLSRSMFSILSVFSKVSDGCPALNPDEFLRFMSGEINDYLC